jgi:hypothetical protein
MAGAFTAGDYAHAIQSLLECLQGIDGFHFPCAWQLNHLDKLRVLEFLNQLFRERH